MEINISFRYLIKIEIKGDELIAHAIDDEEPQKFSLEGATSLNCAYNRLSNLPPLPEELEELNCSFNQLTSLPPLPRGLKKLVCFENQLTSLPLLSKELEELYCSNNQLTSLPATLPKGLKKLVCSHNPLISLPGSLPKALKLSCSNNRLTSLPSTLEGLKELYCLGNPLKYIPFFKERPRHFYVPEPFTDSHSPKHYREGYRIQEINRYLFLSFFNEIGIQIDFLEV